MEWSQENILYFIEQYRNKPVLWDPQDSQYFNKIKKNDAWQQLADELEITQDECKRKITSLLASLRREKAKIVKSKSTGKGAEEVYKSTWFAFKALTFLVDRNKPRPTKDSIEIIAEMEESMAEAEYTPVTTIDAPTTADAPATTIDPPTTIDAPHPPRAKKTKTNAQSPEQMMASAFTILKNASQKSETATRPALDESDSFGIFLSNKLKTYSRTTRNVVQHSISNILFEADQGRYEVVYGRMNTHEQSYASRPHSSTSTYLSTPSPHPSSQSLGEKEDANNYIAASRAHPSQAQTLTTLLPRQSWSQVERTHQGIHTQDEYIQEDHTHDSQESEAYLGEFSDLIN